IAVLRVDDRGVGASQGNSATASFEDLEGDVLAGISYLKTRQEIDPKQIGLIGHSEGGIVGPSVAAQSKDVAFVVMLAGPGVQGDKVLLAQNELVLRSAGAATEAIDWQVAMVKQMIAVVKVEKDEKAASEKMRAIWDKAKAALPEPIRSQANPTEAQIT